MHDDNFTIKNTEANEKHELKIVNCVFPEIVLLNNSIMVSRCFGWTTFAIITSSRWTRTSTRSSAFA